MLLALRDISIGDQKFERGEAIPAEAQRLLPPGRLEQLKSSRRVEEITDEADIAAKLETALTEIADLRGRVEVLEDAPVNEKKVA